MLPLLDVCSSHISHFLQTHIMTPLMLKSHTIARHHVDLCSSLVLLIADYPLAKSVFGHPRALITALDSCLTIIKQHR